MMIIQLFLSAVNAFRSPAEAQSAFLFGGSVWPL